MPHKARRFFDSLYRAAVSKGLNCGISYSYQPCKALVIYGLGGADRYPIAKDHINGGGVVLAFDIGYWDRDLAKRKFRFSINGLHPTQVMEGKTPPEDRWKQAKMLIESVSYDPAAPIMLVGNAPKSIAIGAENWTAKMSKQIRKHFPDKKILYRPKPQRPEEPAVVFDLRSTEPIEIALRGVSLVVCRHSNVAVDACKLGIPVVATDGAAAAIYPNTLKKYKKQPDLATRTSFLTRLAYWQWSQDETKLFWNWFFATFPAYDYRKLS